MTQGDVLFQFRLRTIALAGELGNSRAACRIMGIHPSTFYRWRQQAVRYGPEMLRPRERRQPRMPNAISHLVEQRVIAFSLAHPGFGPQRIAAERGWPILEFRHPVPLRERLHVRPAVPVAAVVGVGLGVAFGLAWYGRRRRARMLA